MAFNSKVWNPKKRRDSPLKGILLSRKKCLGVKNGKNGFFDILREKGLKNDKNKFFLEKSQKWPQKHYLATLASEVNFMIFYFFL